MSEKVNYKSDSKGQLELDGIDTPLGEKAEIFVAAAIKARKSKEAADDAMDDLAVEMKSAKIRTLKFKGDTLRYQPGHTTPEKIKFMPSDD